SGVAPGALGLLWGAGSCWGARPDLSPTHTGVFQKLSRSEYHFINDTDRVTYVERSISNREQLLDFDSDVGHYVGDTQCGEINAGQWNSQLGALELKRGQGDNYCRDNCKLYTAFSVEHRGELGAERVPTGPGLGMTLEPLKTSMGIIPAPSALLVPMPGASSASPMTRVALFVHLRISQCRLRASISADLGVSGGPDHCGPPEMLPDATHSKMVTGNGGFMLGFVFLALGLGFYLRKKVG
ncbi:HB2D protein, partial [Origma solitaria]|nr:HB2D protein [Origma solitaria]